MEARRAPHVYALPHPDGCRREIDRTKLKVELVSFPHESHQNNEHKQTPGRFSFSLIQQQTYQVSSPSIAGSINSFIPPQPPWLMGTSHS